MATSYFEVYEGPNPDGQFPLTFPKVPNQPDNYQIDQGVMEQSIPYPFDGHPNPRDVTNLKQNKLSMDVAKGKKR